MIYVGQSVQWSSEITLLLHRLIHFDVAISKHKEQIPITFMKWLKHLDIHTNPLPSSLKSSINTSSAVGGRRDEAVSTSHNTTTLSLISSHSPRDYRHKWWVGSFCTLPSRFLSLSLHLLPDSVLLHTHFLSTSLPHKLPRVPALLRGHPSKFLHRPCSS